MRITRVFTAPITVLLLIGYVGLSSFTATPAVAQTTTATSNLAVGPQYDTTHVYVAPTDFDRFVASVVATFGGTASKKGVFTVTPTRIRRCPNWYSRQWEPSQFLVLRRQSRIHLARSGRVIL
jgi:hypothetical protein